MISGEMIVWCSVVFVATVGWLVDGYIEDLCPNCNLYQDSAEVSAIDFARCLVLFRGKGTRLGRLFRGFWTNFKSELIKGDTGGPGRRLSGEKRCRYLRKTNNYGAFSTESSGKEKKRTTNDQHPTELGEFA